MSESSQALDPAALLDGVVGIVEAAGELVMDVYRGTFSVSAKADGSPVSSADLAAEASIVADLPALGAYPLMSEESGAVPFDRRRAWTTFWLVDPLDGTREFVKRNGEFTVNVALVHRGRPVLGVVSAPALGVTYWAAEGAGAFVRRSGGVPQRLAPRDHGGPLRVAVSRSHGGDALPGFLASLGSHEAVPMGSSLKICLVAEGVADLYPRLGPTCEWDVAAADCVVREAGGALCDFDGDALVYNKEEILNPWFFAAVSKRAREAALRAGKGSAPVRS